MNTLLSSKSSIKSVDDALCLNNLQKALTVRAAFKVKRAMDQMAAKTQEGVSENERVHSLLAVDLVSMAHAHIMLLAFNLFKAAVENPATYKCGNLRETMKDLARLFALNELVNG